jgi:hypothetical protein
MQKTVQKGYNVNAESAPEVKRQRTIGPPVPVKLLIEDVMYDLNGGCREVEGIPPCFRLRAPHREATTVNMRAVELCAKQIHPLMLDNDIFLRTFCHWRTSWDAGRRLPR